MRPKSSSTGEMKFMSKVLIFIIAGIVLTFACQPVFAAYDGLTSGILGVISGAGEIAKERREQEEQLERQKQLIREEYRLREEHRLQQEEKERQRQAAANEAKKKTEEEDRRNSISTGSGFFIAPNGYLVTNAHVIDGYENIFIRTQNRRLLKATVIAIDKERDLALLKVEGKYTPLRVDQTGRVSKGQRVMAIGYPQPTIQGSESKVTDGVISSFTGLRNDDNWFQISVPIQGGNSGGPLINEDGVVIGIVVATVNAQKFLSITGSIPQNVNFAIKSNVLSDFLAEQQVRNIGYSSKRMSIDAVDHSTVLIIAKHDNEVSSPVPPVEKGLPPSAETAPQKYGSTFQFVPRLGMSVMELSNEQIQKMQVNGGLLIDIAESPSALAAGILKGDVILAIGNMPLHSVDQLNDILRPLARGRKVALLIRRNNAASYVGFALDGQ